MNNSDKIDKMDEELDALSNSVAVLEARVSQVSYNVKEKHDKLSNEISLTRTMITEVRVNLAKVTKSTKIIWTLLGLFIAGALTFVGNLLVKLL